MNLKKIGIITTGIIAALIATSYGIDWWINAKLPRLISEKNETPYHIKYSKIEVSLFSKTIVASAITVIPKEREKDNLRKNGIFASIEQITIENYGIIPLLFKNKIEAEKITFTKPKITLFKGNDKNINSTKGISSRIVAPFQQIIKVTNVDLEKGSFYVINLTNSKTLFQAKNVTIQINKIAISEKTLKRKIPFDFKTYAFSCDSLLYLTNGKYQIQADQIATTNTGITISNFEMQSLLDRKQFVSQSAKEQDHYNLKSDKISITNMNWGFRDEILFFSTNRIAIDQAEATIYRSKLPPEDRSIKPLYNKLLRELPFTIQVDTLSISNSRLVYEEEKSFEKGAGILTFDAFNLQANHLNSGFQKTKLPDVTISIRCKFMKKSPMTIDWRFNVMDSSDSFTIKGSIINLKTTKLAVFTKPYLNATFTGNFEQIYFNFSGNNTKANGNFALRYNDLKLNLFQKNNRKKKNNLKSWIANLLLKNDSNGALIENEVAVERNKEKSFFNYLWLCIADGLKKTLA